MYSLGIVGDAFLGIILTLDTWIYSLISSAYKIFMAIASARLLSSDAYTEIANKVYIIIGVGMLFVLAYAILRAIIDPDQLSKGDMAGGKVLKSVAKAVIGLIITPFLFTLAYNVQSKVLEESILSKLFFRTSDSVVEVEGVGSVNYDEMISSTGGAVTATSVWQAFFYPADGVDPNEIEADAEIVRQTANLAAAGCAASVGVAAVGLIAGFFTGGAAWVVSGAAVLSCVNAVIQDGNADKVEDAVGSDGKFTLTEAYTMVSAGESFAIFQAFLEPISDGDIKYTWFISTVFGAFVAYAFVTYAIDMGVRAAKLAYYQIIAPIPLILQILPKSGDKLDKFVKEVLKTFLDVFVRISIVYIIVYMICHLSELFSTVGALWNNNELSGTETLIAKALLIIGLVLFAKQAPKMIGDTFGLNTGGSLDGLNLMKKLREGELFTAGHVVGGTALSAVKNFRQDWGQNKDKPWHKRLGHAALSGAAGGGSAAVRGVRDRFSTGKPVGSFKDMKGNIVNTSEKVTDKKNERERFYKEYGTDENGKERGTVETFVYGHAKQIGDSIDKFTSPTIDTSYEDKTISMYGKYADQRDTFRTKTGKREEARYAQKVVESIKKEGPPSEFNEEAYRAAVNAAAASVDRTGMTEDQYKQAVARAVANVDRDAYRNKDYLTELAAYQSRTNAAVKFEEATQDIAYLQLLAKGDAATLAGYQQFFTDNIADIRSRANEVIYDKSGQRMGTLSEVLRDNYGLDITTGKVDYSKAKPRDVQYEIETFDQATGKSSKIVYTVDIDDKGNAKYFHTDASGNKHYVSMEKIAERATKSDVVNVDAKSSINDATDYLKATKNKNATDDGYVGKKVKQRAQKNGK